MLEISLSSTTCAIRESRRKSRAGGCRANTWLPASSRPGRAGAIATSVLLVISPAFLYFSRFIRHDIYVDAFTLMMVIGVFRYLATGNRSWFYTACVSAALLFATKEDFYISGFIPFVFLLGAWFLLKGERRLLFRARVRALGVRPWVIGGATFVGINLLLYTTFLTNLQGVCTALVSLPLNGCAGSMGAQSGSSTGSTGATSSDPTAGQSGSTTSGASSAGAGNSAAGARLPQTASPLPLLAMAGAGLVGTGFFSRRKR